jgi:hypothetical protein
MKVLKHSLLILFAALAFFSCNARMPEEQKTEITASEDIQVYYFHNTLRCATCNAVEDETKMALEMFYGEKMKAGTIAFTSLNLEEEEGEKLAQTLQVSGQTLLITKGGIRVNLTNEGFMNARTNPTRFHEILKAQIDQLL